MEGEQATAHGHLGWKAPAPHLARTKLRQAHGGSSQKKEPSPRTPWLILASKGLAAFCSSFEAGQGKQASEKRLEVLRAQTNALVGSTADSWAALRRPPPL